MKGKWKKIKENERKSKEMKRNERRMEGNWKANARRCKEMKGK